MTVDAATIKEIARLKAKARKALIRYHSSIKKVNCPDGVTQLVSPTTYRMAEEYDRTMEALKKIDPGFLPSYKPLTAKM